MINYKIDIKLKVIRIILLVILISATNELFSQFECKQIELDGSVVFNAVSRVKVNIANTNNIQKDAILTILFSGIPKGNNCVYLPPLINSEKSTISFNQIEKQFFSINGDWARFVQIQKNDSNYSIFGNNNVRYSLYNITISRRRLLEYLQNKKVIQKLNFGF